METNLYRYYFNAYGTDKENNRVIVPFQFDFETDNPCQCYPDGKKIREEALKTFPTDCTYYTFLNTKMEKIK